MSWARCRRSAYCLCCPRQVNRSRSCTVCGQQRVRDQVRIGTPTDPDYAVAICPTCDRPPRSTT